MRTNKASHKKMHSKRHTPKTNPTTKVAPISHKQTHTKRRQDAHKKGSATMGVKQMSHKKTPNKRHPQKDTHKKTPTKKQPQKDTHKKILTTRHTQKDNHKRTPTKKHPQKDTHKKTLTTRHPQKDTLKKTPTKRQLKNERLFMGKSCLLSCPTTWVKRQLKTTQETTQEWKWCIYLINRHTQKDAHTKRHPQKDNSRMKDFLWDRVVSWVVPQLGSRDNSRMKVVQISH